MNDNAALVELLEKLRDLLAQQPADCLGCGSLADGQQYPIRDEVISNITKALATSPAKTPAERKADERERMRALGFVLRQVWVHEDDVERFAKYVRRFRPSRRTHRGREVSGAQTAQ